MDHAYWTQEIGEAQEALEAMGPTENLRLILWLILVDRVDSIATSLQQINDRLELERQEKV